MTAIKAIRTPLVPRLDRVHDLIVDALGSPNPLMNRVVEHHLSHRGKELRPMLAIITSELLGGDCSYPIEAPAAAIEMLHNASLIHDDVIDASDMRHGARTINALWDNHIAVLVGDFFVSRALSLAASTADLRVIETLSGLGARLSLGEMSQLDYARGHSLTEQSYFDVIAHKTASLFVACVEVGAYSAGVDDERLDLLRRYAHIFGCCFQITDDIFDYFPSAELGKPTGNDLREGKVTLPLLGALASGHPEAPAMRELLGHDTLTDADIDRLTDFAIRAGGIEYARATVDRLRAEAAEIAVTLAPAADPNPLTVLLDYVASRTK